jgi:hypothetical protein
MSDALGCVGVFVSFFDPLKGVVVAVAAADATATS